MKILCLIVKLTFSYFILRLFFFNLKNLNAEISRRLAPLGDANIPDYQYQLIF